MNPFNRLIPRAISVALLACLLIAVAHLAAYGQGIGNRLSGFVFTEDRAPLADVSLELYSNDSGQYVGRAKTNGSGQFSFFGLRGTNYRLRVMPQGTNYEEQTQTIEFYNSTRTLSNGQAITSWDSKIVDFYLKPRPGPDGAIRKATFVVAQDIPPKAKEAFEKALADFDNKRPAEGVAGLNEALQIFPTYYSALRRLGIEYLQSGKPAEAAQLFVRAAKVYNEDSENWYGIGYALYNMKEYPGAAAALLRSFQLDGKSVQAALLLGMTYRLVKQSADAETYLKKADALAKGTNPEVHHQLSLLYANDFQKYRLAADELEKYLKLQPDSPDAARVKDLIKKLRLKAAAEGT